MFHYVNLIYSEHPNSELQWNAEIQTRSDFGQITFVWEQFMFKCNSVRMQFCLKFERFRSDFVRSVCRPHGRSVFCLTSLDHIIYKKKNYI